MLKRNLPTVISAAAVALLLAACSGPASNPPRPAEIGSPSASSPAIQSSAPEPSTSMPADIPTTAPSDVPKLRNKASVTQEDSDGYKRTITIKLTDWIKGQDSDTVRAAWNEVGGSGDVPIIDGNYQTGQYGGDPFTVTNVNLGAYAFGMITIKNATSGYSLSDWDGGQGHAQIYNVSDFSNPWHKYGDTAAGGACVIFSGANRTCFRIGDSVWEFIPQLSGDQWGPAPIVIFAGKVFTPKQPKGNPALKQFELGISKMLWDTHPDDRTISSVKLGFSWTK